MTQTTVGYGVPYPIAKYEMIFVMIVQFCGGFLFSMITGEVFQWRREVTVEKMVKN